jgi:hypothetical protein
MLLANTLQSLLLTWPTKDILELFLDHPGPNQVFGIHNICEQGRHTMRKEPGDWYGVNSIAQVLDVIFEQPPLSPLVSDVFGKLSMITFPEGTIFMDQVLEKVREGINLHRAEEMGKNQLSMAFSQSSSSSNQ